MTKEDYSAYMTSIDNANLERSVEFRMRMMVVVISFVERMEECGEKPNRAYLDEQLRNEGVSARRGE